MKVEMKIERVLKHGNFEIVKVTSRKYGDWKYSLLYNGLHMLDSYSFEQLRDIAYSNKPWKWSDFEW